ncbi:hypothetical protein EDD11_001868 [Mortierella claussenii]|nr:hypothetical protein EDD11_001868 [Mortierella claussenii]
MNPTTPAFSVHQTSLHAVLVIHTRDIDPHSIATHVASVPGPVEISYQHHTLGLTLSQTKLTVQPILSQLCLPAMQPLAVVRDCSYSVTADNMVFKFSKASSAEWQALEVVVKSEHAGSSTDMVMNADWDNVLSQQGGQCLEALLIKFPTVTNASELHTAMQTSPCWDPVGFVGKIQAKKVQGANAIQMTVELTRE